MSVVGLAAPTPVRALVGPACRAPLSVEVGPIRGTAPTPVMGVLGLVCSAPVSGVLGSIRRTAPTPTDPTAHHGGLARSNPLDRPGTRIGLLSQIPGKMLIAMIAVDVASGRDLAAPPIEAAGPQFKRSVPAPASPLRSKMSKHRGQRQGDVGGGGAG